MKVLRKHGDRGDDTNVVEQRDQKRSVNPRELPPTHAVESPYPQEHVMTSSPRAPHGVICSSLLSKSPLFAIVCDMRP
jgi:hypothetical protein